MCTSTRRRSNPEFVAPGPLDLGAEVVEQLHHRLDVADSRDVCERHRFGGEEARGEDRQGAVLVAGRAHAAVERAAALDDEGLHDSFGEGDVRHEKAAILPTRLEVTRDRAWATLTRYTTSEALLRHALAVEASVRAYARKLDGDEELWGAVALLPDFDYEIHPTLDRHPQDGAPILREEGYPE